MGVNSLPKTVTRQRHSCDLNPGPSVPESSTLTTRLASMRQDLRNNTMSVHLSVGLFHLAPQLRGVAGQLLWG